MERKVLIAGMWGTTNLQLMLLKADSLGMPHIADSRGGPGASGLKRSQFEDVLLKLTQDWRRANPDVDVHLAGMVGSTIGWMDAGYSDCPAMPREKVITTQISGTRVRIVGGMRCVNCFGEVDLMRGEETEVAGWLASSAAGTAPQQVVVVPGTHTKWIRIADGAVRDFLTSVTGECFAGFAGRGILLPKPAVSTVEAGPAFLDGVRVALSPGFSLLHWMFSVRSRQVAGNASAADSVQRLSGLLIGSDVAGAIALLGLRESAATVIVIGNPALAAHYKVALREAGIQSKTVDSLNASAAGLWNLRAVCDAVPT